MDFENTWAAVFAPGLATRYFEAHADRPFRVAALATFDRLNAWWLAELSRLVYRQERDEIGTPARGRTRNAVLAEVGWRETAFINRGGSQAMVVEPSNPDAERVAVVVFRGSDDVQSWLDFNFDLPPVPWPGGGKVHEGFKDAFELVWPGIAAALPAGVPVVHTGHSLGGALATLAASRRPGASACTFGSPRVGDARFGATIARDTFFRVVNNRDIVTEVPPVGLEHVGLLQYIASDGRLIVDPDAGVVVRDRLRRDPSFDHKRNLRDKLTGPPQPLADHAPVNYVAHLERVV